LFAIGRGSKPALFGAEFAPIGALMGKRAEKPGENRQKSEGKWRKMDLVQIEVTKVRLLGHF
jgi:hypothetical protein